MVDAARSGRSTRPSAGGRAPRWAGCRRRGSAAGALAAALGPRAAGAELEGRLAQHPRLDGLGHDGGEARQRRLGGQAMRPVERRAPGGRADRQPEGGIVPSASASSWSRQPWAASSTLVRISEARSWTTSSWRRGSVSCGIIHSTMPLRSMISRSTTTPASPVSRSARLSTRRDLLKRVVKGCSVSPMACSGAAVGLCLAA